MKLAFSVVFTADDMITDQIKRVEKKGHRIGRQEKEDTKAMEHVE